MNKPDNMIRFYPLTHKIVMKSAPEPAGRGIISLDIPIH